VARAVAFSRSHAKHGIAACANGASIDRIEAW